MNLLRTIGGVLTAVVAAGALGLASRAPYAPPGSERALLRMSWRWRGEKLETCRKRSEAELAALPVHMRTPEICTGHLVSYRLVVRIDEQRADSMVFVPEGAKGDRPIFVLKDIPLQPGTHDVRITFAPVTSAEVEVEPLAYHERIEARAGHIELITIAQDRSSLIRSGPRQPNRDDHD